MQKDDDGHTPSQKDIHPDATVAPSAVVKNSIINAGATVYEQAVVRDSTVERNATVGNYTVVRSSTLRVGSRVGAHAEIARSEIQHKAGFHSGYVGDSVIGERSAIGAGTVIANCRLDTDPDGPKNGAIIGSNVRIGVNVSIMPGVEIGDAAVIGPGTLLKKDVEDRAIIYATQSKQRDRSRGSADD